MNYWFISDTHFFHDNIIQYSGRPFSSVEEMNEHLIANWNEYISHNDVVYHLGDVAMGKDFDKIREICSRLNGSIHLVPGNHDTNAKLQIYSDYFTIEPLICVPKKLNVVLCHYPIASWTHMSTGMIHFHGHCHGSFTPEGKMIDVGVDVSPKYRHKHLDELKAQLTGVNVILKDHHGTHPQTYTANH